MDYILACPHHSFYLGCHLRQCASDLQCSYQTSISPWGGCLAPATVRKAEGQKGVAQRPCSQNGKCSKQMPANSIWCLSCNPNLSTEDRDIHIPTQSIPGCKASAISTQTQEVWHEESDQECMFEDTQQAVKKKILITAAVNADWRESQNSVNRDMIKEWVLRKSFSF